MRAGLCHHCQAELPEGGRFCVMCGRAQGGANSPSPSESLPAPSEQSPPSLGHALRDSSPDRRVYTSPVGHVVPIELLAELREAGAGGRSSLGGSDVDAAGPLHGEKTARIAIDQPPARQSRAPLTPDNRRPLRLPPAVGASTFAARWRPLVNGLLWAALLSWLGAGVGWAVFQLLHPAGPATPLVATSPPAASPPAATDRRPSPPPRPPAAPKPPGAMAPASVLAVPTPPAVVALAAAAAAPAQPAAGGAAAAPSAPTWLQLHDDVEFVASAHRPQVRACYERVFRHAGAEAPAGRVELSFTLIDAGDGGRAVDIVTELNLLGNQTVANCLEERLGEWRFPRPPARTPGAPPPRLRYPFVFAPAP